MLIYEVLKTLSLSLLAPVKIIILFHWHYSSLPYLYIDSSLQRYIQISIVGLLYKIAVLNFCCSIFEILFIQVFTYATNSFSKFLQKNNKNQETQFIRINATMENIHLLLKYRNSHEATIVPS